MPWPVSLPKDPVARGTAVARTRARTPGGVPWIEVGNGACASCVFLAATYGAGMGLDWAAAAGLAAWTGWRMAFGTDADVRETYAGVNGMAPEVVATVIAMCERDLETIRLSIEVLPQAAADFCEEVDGIVDHFRRDPPSVSSGRRFVEVYLRGVAMAVTKYLRLLGDGPSPDTEASMQDLLTAAATTAAQQRRALVADAKLDLDLDVQVLRSRMTAELPMPNER